jgi:DNA-directed RNA polymerase specialized sigma24 family protein
MAPNEDSRMNSSYSSVTEWLMDLKRGGDRGAQQLWERYYVELISAAHRKLGRLPHRAEDAEDVATMAFTAFFRGVEQQRFPKLDDRDDLWQVLLMVAERRAADVVRRENAERRGAGMIRCEAELDQGVSTTGRAAGIDGVPGPSPTPETIDGLAAGIRERWEALGDENLGRIALDKLQGYTNLEIAERTGIALRSVERKLQLIKSILRHDG